QFCADTLPWTRAVDIALPCATQNEVDGDMAQTLVDQGTSIIAEGANMPLTANAQRVVADAGLLHAPGKAANAGGVAVSGLEMSQNSHGQFVSAEEVDQKLRDIMHSIHRRIADAGREGTRIDYGRGANVAAYRKVAQAVTAMGAI
ncbi:MAG: NADP-specific glutamate dehydrogenase, partial [Pseudomonadota bacterium]